MIQSNCKFDSLTVDQWQSHVESQPNSSIFHHRNWLELLHEQYGFKIQIPAIVENGQVRAAIPFLQTRNLRGTKKLVSLPFTDYMQILADDQQAIEPLCQNFKTEIPTNIQDAVIRADQPIQGLYHESLNVCHELKSDLSMDEIKKAFDPSINRNLKKGERQQLEFQKRSDDEAINIFYRLHVLTRKKLGVPVQPKSYFRRLNSKLIKTGLGFVVVITRQKSPIAAGIMLGFNGRLTYKYAASHPSALEFRPNDWLVYNAIRVASEEGYRVFDFGLSDKQQEGLRRFKRKWGATESDIYYNYVLGEPDENPGQSRAVQFAGEIIKRSPTVVCRALGKAFYKYSQ